MLSYTQKKCKINTPALCSKILTDNPFEIAIFNGLGVFVINFDIFKEIFFENSDHGAYSDLKPVDGGQSLYPMVTVMVPFIVNVLRYG